MDHELKQLFQQLGEAINLSLTDSEEITEAIEKIKSSGYDVVLVLEATIGFSRKPEQEGVEEESPETEDVQHALAEFKISSQDRKFLRSLRIKLDEAA